MIIRNISWEDDSAFNTTELLETLKNRNIATKCFCLSKSDDTGRTDGRESKRRDDYNNENRIILQYDEETDMYYAVDIC